ncbi:P protein-like [Centruroides vittatus]|uniref:P protein-like n=1 Tax=Centruroides vittatus TaxID=120091 RepID=UPI00350EA028
MTSVRIESFPESSVIKILRSEISKKCNETTPLLHSKDQDVHQVYVNGDDGFSNASSTDEKELGSSCDTRYYLNICKLVVLCASVLFAVVALSFIEEKSISWMNIAIKNDHPVHINLSEKLDSKNPILHISAMGPFLPEKYLNFSQNRIYFKIMEVTPSGLRETSQPTWVIPASPAYLVNDIESTLEERSFNLLLEKELEGSFYQLIIGTEENNDYISMAVSLSYQPPIALDSIIMAGCVLVGLYILIIFELVHRTLAAIIGATVAIGFLSVIGERPSLLEVISWLDVETLSLLFGMMIMVAIFCETGFFDYFAILAFRLARGRALPLLTALCLFTLVMSAFLDNVTTILLITAVTIRLCEVLNVDPKHFLIAMIIFSNIGGASTPVGDPPNVIIINNSKIKETGLDFSSFILHAFPNILLCTLCTYLFLKVMYRKQSSMQFEEPPEVVELKHEINVWKKARNSLSGYSRDEMTVKALLKKKIQLLKTLLRKKLYDARPSDDNYLANLEELSSKYKIRNKVLLAKSSIVLITVIILFFLQSVPSLNLSLGWIALLGAIMLLILADFDEIESVLGRVEWSTLLFFAALFVVMEALTKLRLIWFIGQMTQDFISSVDENQRLLVAIVVILWVSALASSFIDNIPFTTAMVQIITDLSDNDELDLPLIPLVYALSFGACLGGNGTLIGASANVVCAGLSEQHGYRFTFMDFFKIGFPVMLITTVVSNLYLIVCHVFLQWNE